MTKITCDRCGVEIDRNSNWGNCTTCGDDLCEKCSGGFTDDGECGDCFDKRMNAHADAEARLIFNISDGR